jgi:membrane fusion protein
VTLLYDAFPYQRYGARHGTVWWAGPNGAAPDDSGSFRALVDIDARPIVVRGRPQRLLPGMSGHARVVVGRRSILGYLFEPIRALHENLSDGGER